MPKGQYTRRKPTRTLHPPKPRKVNPERVKQATTRLEANRLVTVRLSMRHYINGIPYGPGEVKVPHNLAQGMLHTEGHAEIIEEQFQGSKAAIIGARSRTGAVSVKEVAPETFDDAYGAANPSDVIKGSQYGTDQGQGNRF